MLLNVSNKINKNNIDINLTKNLLGVDVKILNSNKYQLSDNLFSQIVNINKFELISYHEKYEKLITTLNIAKNQVDYSKILPKHRFRNDLCAIKDIINKILNISNTYYFDVLDARNQLTDNLQQVFINNELSKIPKYRHDTTLTGRMTVKSGLNFLTMGKHIKQKIRPLYKKNKIIEIDFSSCEPNFLNHVLGNKKIDIYNYFQSKFGHHDRGKIKLAVISTLYGATISTVKKITGLNKENILDIRSFFHIEDITKYLLEQYSKFGKIENAYGRPILEKGSSLLNYWVQSSVADFTCLSFYNLIKELHIKPIAIIHDAMLLEVNDDMFKKVSKINYLHDDRTNISLKINIKEIK